MTPFAPLYDVAVIDEIQLIADPERGDESLRGDLSLIQKGDCVVTFSRKSIFGLKSRIEERTGLRCAVAYGRLPPEIRSEQAALFNDPNSGYDVLIGSDAIGMGLNLKIKRIVFEAVRKPCRTIRLTRQRFLRGIVTTLHEPDLAVLRKALVAPFNPLPYACMQVYPELFRDISYTLPLNAGSSTAMEAFTYVSKMHPSYEFEDITKLKTALEFIDRFTADLTVPDRLMIRLAPTPWRDSELYESLEDVEAMMKSDNSDDLVPTADMLQQLESLHKIVVVYLWLSYRLTIAFPDMEDAFLLRERAENAMDSSVGIKYFTGKDAKMLKKQTTTVHKRAQNVSGGPMKEFDDLVIR
ncbi:ATP-dependent RNA helicase suv3, mitochondrial [Grifola frondosa]|uniref:ATP-dependent RNA helicase suv3, mitochondrial n=1 Tax=Grifola frondosa TaxID=5627 RepID=A0A1C7MEW6_GRIFR|nr:ATP-dependent RNA helicase suv3, mitochondrial [Grifola frondosa]